MTRRYQHSRPDGGRIDLPVGKVVCVGRNYADHARELNNPVPSSPLLFIKPATALVPLCPTLRLPVGSGAVQHEAEVALLIGRALDSSSSIDPLEAIIGIGMALDLTLREVQEGLKKLGHPWEIAKGFDGACPCSGFIDADQFNDLQNISFRLRVNGQDRQAGNTRDMLFPIRQLAEEITRHFTLLPGDIVLTGTPAGVGPLQAGDHLTLEIERPPVNGHQNDSQWRFDTQILD